jgi:hypothetical protein
MTILSKIKTLIEYAKFGMFVCKANAKIVSELFVPRAISNYDNDYIIIKNCLSYANKVTGYLTTFQGPSMLKYKPVEIIDLPYCTYIGDNHWGNSNISLKVLKLPKLRQVTAVFRYSDKLEYLELGAVTNFATNALEKCVSLKECYIAEGTTSSLFLYPCPNLTQECLHKIIENLADMTGTTGPNFHVGAENLKKIDQKHIIMLEEKNFLYQ